MTRKELLALPKSTIQDSLHNVHGVWVIPNGKKHDSGWACMEFVASVDGKNIRFGGGCDDISFIGSHFRMDCEYPSRIIHIWNSSNSNFDILNGNCSSVTFIQR